MSTKTLGVVGRGSGWQNSIPTIPTIPTVPTIPTIPTPWGCSKLKPVFETGFIFPNWEIPSQYQTGTRASIYQLADTLQHGLIAEVSWPIHHTIVNIQM